MNIEEFRNNIPSFIEQAIENGKSVPDCNICLTASLECINELDTTVEYLHKLWDKHLINDTVAWNVSVMLGTLLGEMIISERCFHWVINIEDLPVVETEEKNTLSPITKIYKIITDNNHCEGTARGFYEGFRILEKYHSLSDDEKERLTTYITDFKE